MIYLNFSEKSPLLNFAKNIKKYMDLYQEVEVDELPQLPDRDEIRDLMNEGN